MEITEVHLTLVNKPGDRLRAFCSLTFDDAFVVKDLKIVEGSGGLFLAMPSRKRTVKCPRCCEKNPANAAYCSKCGDQLDDETTQVDGHLYADIAHPITAAFRTEVEKRVIEAYRRQLSTPRVTKASSSGALANQNPSSPPHGRASLQRRVDSAVAGSACLPHIPCSTATACDGRPGSHGPQERWR